MVHVQNHDVSSIFFNFDFFWFLEGGGGKRAKNDLNLTNSVCFALYLRNCGSYGDFDNISRSFSLIFLKNASL